MRVGWLWLEVNTEVGAGVGGKGDDRGGQGKKKIFTSLPSLNTLQGPHFSIQHCLRSLSTFTADTRNH